MDEKGRLKSEIAAYVRERDAAFEADDISWAAARLPKGTDRRTVEMAFHKARAAATNVSDLKRAESEMWLADQGVGPVDLVEDSNYMRSPKIPRGSFIFPMLAFIVLTLLAWLAVGSLLAAFGVAILVTAGLFIVRLVADLPP